MNEKQEFKCGGLLGAILKLSQVAGADESELHEMDDKWQKMINSHSSLNNSLKNNS